MTAKPAILRMPSAKPPAKEKKRRNRGAGRLYQRGNTWWFAYHVRGEKVRESAHTDNKTEAQKQLTARLAENQQNGGGPSSHRLTYEALREALYEDYETKGNKSLKHHKKDGEHHKKDDRFLCTVHPALDGFFAGYKAEDITVAAIKRFVRQRQKDKVSNSTINASLSMLRSMFSLQVKENRFPVGLVPHFPMQPKDQPRQDFLTPNEYSRLLAELHPDSKPLLTVAYYCGARLGELLKLKWKDVDFTAGLMVFRDTKNSEDREVPMIGSSREALEALRKAHAESEYVFVRANGERIVTFRKAWLGATKRAGLEGNKFHGTRRSAAVNLMAAGVDSQLARQITGHKDARTFESYRVLLRSDKLQAAKAVETYLNGHSLGTNANR